MNMQEIRERQIAELSAALYEKGLYARIVADLDPTIVNVHSSDACDQTDYLYTLTLTVTP